jgi:ribosomal protein S18 acetylase RimI-like enzyme
MASEPDLYYFCKPVEVRPVAVPIEFLGIQEFLGDESACRVLWELVANQFRTRSKFLTIWQTVRHVALHRNAGGQVDGFLLVTSPLNWQIDYVVVSPDARGQGIAAALLCTVLNQAYRQGVPYVMLTSKDSLRPLYESCGFEVVRSCCPV